MKFIDLGLSNYLLQALENNSHTTPTPIQQQAIPQVLANKDLIGIADTGTGKTAAFILPFLHKMEQEERNSKRVIKGLILTPTRELAMQIQEVASMYDTDNKYRSTVIVGGVKQINQERQLQQGVDLVIATPGRLVDLIQQKKIKLSQINYLVFDEADRMMDMGFKRDIDQIVAQLPREKQTLLFSATMPDVIRKMSVQMLNNPVQVQLASVSKDNSQINQKIYLTNKDVKKDLLLHILKKGEVDQAIIFTRTKHGSERLHRFLQKSGLSSDAIHGDKVQNRRDKALLAFKEQKIKFLVATDVASRGIDIDALGHVINYELPADPETYVHRIGRVGRAGLSGVALSLIEPEELEMRRLIEKHLNQTIEIVKEHPFPQTDKAMTPAEKKAYEKKKNIEKMAQIEKRRASKKHSSFRR